MLLYNGDTVCDDYFDSNAADAICREMGYADAVGRWNSGWYHDYQNGYDIGLDDVLCESGSWSSCTFIESHNCGHHEDVFLACDVPGEPNEPG